MQARANTTPGRPTSWAGAAAIVLLWLLLAGAAVALVARLFA